MEFNYHDYPYNSQRMTVFAKNGMVATSQSLAAQVGIDTLKRGGNAVDAAVATAATLTVVEPTSNGIGSDAFALVWIKDKLYGLNSSGPAPKNISIEKVKKLGFDQMPKHGFVPVTIPGAPAAWAELSARFGKLSFKETLEPAVNYAREGYPVSPVTARAWKKSYQQYKDKLTAAEFEEWFKVFAPAGRAPRAGEIWKSEAHARTLAEIAETEAESFYRGELADKIDEFSAEYKGFIRKEDLADFQPQWVEPISVNYRGYDVWEIPPNGQGLITLMTLNILKQFDFNNQVSADIYHKVFEAIKLAFTDGKKYITDIDKMKVKIEDLLSEEYAKKRKGKIGEMAQKPVPGKPPQGGTVYLAAADSEGNYVSFIQSNYMGFGSGLVVPDTGIALQNRGNNFSLNPKEHNSLAPEKKTYHTIIPGFLTKDNQPVGPFGVMGGFMQPQGHIQVIMNTIDFKLNPQAALDAPRWQWTEGKKFKVEHAFSKRIAELLAGRGHEIEVKLESDTFGKGQIIWRDQKEDVLIGATESRADGAVLGY
jgi:gamma-glutamyltranspeptidase/glutathione hydrolase